MRFTGKLLPPQIDFFTGRMTMLFALNEDFKQAYEELKGCDKLSLEIKRFRPKRSLDANAYYWVLITKLAKVLESSNSEIHNMMLCKYGYPAIIEVDGKEQRILSSIPDTEETERSIRNAETYHLKPTTQIITGTNGQEYRTYVMMRGSSDYNSEEMARLIKGTISDCKDAGIPDREIATPEEQRLLKEKYNIEL